MRVTQVTDSSQFDKLAADWNRLAAGVPFRTHAWLASWWEHYGHGRELSLLLVRDITDRLVGLAPWFQEPSTTKGQTLAFLGSGEVCTDYLSVLAEPEQTTGVVMAIAKWLREEHESSWDLLHLNGFVADDPAITQLAEKLTELGLTAHERPGMNCWRIALPTEWEAYIESLSKSHRKQVRRVDRRLVDSGEAVLRCVEQPAELDAALAILIDLHQRRRHSLGEPGCFADARFEGFLRIAARRLLAL
ncbi:MAG TPA: GNAT family N-acetyltransferase, partial [Pirellulaceae bacterium]|nr:GNAT family N-acetyltransferase [Pirellulaceae bacterium]